MLRGLRGLFSSDLAIDLGTTNTRVYVQGKGIVLDEPSVVAIRHDPLGVRNNGGILALGEAAKQMLGRAPSNIQVIQPIKDGVIADFAVTGEMLQHFVRRVQKNRVFQSSRRVVICVPCGATQVERRAIRESTMAAGAREVYLIEEPMAAAIGADLPVVNPTGSMVVDIGGGTTEVGVLSLGGIVHAVSLRGAGDKMDAAIISYIREKYGLVVGEATAERIKHEIGTAWHKSAVRRTQFAGLHVGDGLPRSQDIASGELHTTLSKCLHPIVGAIKTALEQTLPELSADVAERGIIITGGGALLRDIDHMLAAETDLPVLIADDPRSCVVRGCAQALQGGDTLGDVLLRE
ncbi:MAG: rod shape-determining protein [Acidiferrobacterales bacterium]